MKRKKKSKRVSKTGEGMKTPYHKNKAKDKLTEAYSAGVVAQLVQFRIRWS